MKCRQIGVVKGTSYKEYKKIKRTLLQVAQKGVSLSASITVEASIVLPLFIFFFTNIMMAFNIIKMQCDMEAALHQTGNELALFAFDERCAEGALGIEEDGVSTFAGALSVFYVKGKVENYLGEELEKGCVTDGRAGLSYLPSKIMLGNDIIDIVIDYKVHPLISLIGFEEFPVEARYYGHAWTGYDISEGAAADENEEEMVYVTEHGEVYHRDINCNHLKLSIRSVSLDDIEKERSIDGSKYYPCEYCGGGISGGNVFITDYGIRYHSSVNCAGLKRKIYTIPISEVGGRRPCSGCG